MNDSREGMRRFGPLAAVILFTGLLFNEYVLAFLFSPDGIITGQARIAIRLLDVGLVALLMVVVLRRVRPPERLLAAVRRWPRATSLAIGMAVSVGLVLTVELGFHAWNTIHARRNPAPVVTYSAPLWQPGVTSRSTKMNDGVTIYDVTYHRDSHGARITPNSPTEPTGRDLVFFGGSFTFGQGVEDDETLPNAVARRVPAWRITNFGFLGHGPAHMLQRIEAQETMELFRGQTPHAVYVFIPHHVRRTIGSMRIATTWARDFPCYEIDDGGALVHLGTMTEGRPRLSRWYRWLAKEPILKCFNVDIPARLGPGDYALTTRVILESRSRWLGAFEDASFTVVLFPVRQDEMQAAARMRIALESQGIDVLDYSTKFGMREDVWIPGDSHPNALAYDTVADWLVRDLALK